MPGLSVQAVLSNRLYKFIRVPELVSGSVMLPRLPLLSFYFAILAMFLPRSCLLWSTADLSSHVPHSAVCRSMIKGAYLFQLFLFFFFFIREGKLSHKTPSRLPHGCLQQEQIVQPCPRCGKAGKASISYFQPLYWEVGFSQKGWESRSGIDQSAIQRIKYGDCFLGCIPILCKDISFREVFFCVIVLVILLLLPGNYQVVFS